MAFRKSETEQLMQNARDQLDRLVQELADLDECKDDMEPDEYTEARVDAMEQLKEFEASLAKMGSGNMSLMDEMSSVRMAVRAAISQAFKTPEVIKMFAARRPNDLRQKLAEIDRDLKIGKLPLDLGTPKKREILTALQKLDQPLSVEEVAWLAQHSSDSSLIKVDDSSNQITDASKILAMSKSF